MADARRMTRPNHLAWLALGSLPVLGGCLVGPDYEIPESDVNEEWVVSRASVVSSDPITNMAWWTVFEDPVLDRLVEEAFAQNLTLRQAGVRVVQAMAQRGIAVGDLFPQTQQLNGSFDRSRFSENTSSPQSYESTWDMAFDAAWELDVWGKFRRGIESADAGLMASVADYDDAMVSLVAEIAATYVEIRTLEARLEIALANIEIQSESLRLATSRFDNGQTSELDVVQARSALEQTRADVPALRASRRQTLLRLDTLLGRAPRRASETIQATGDIPDAPTTVAIGIPADLLRRRPDVRATERRAAAQSARIGVAVADLLPVFFISGSLGLRSNDADDTFDSDSWTGSVMPGFSWPILNYGRIKNNIRVEDAAFQAAILEYQDSVITAASEVESGLAGFLGSREQAVHVRESVTASRRALEISKIQYTEGDSTFTRVLDSQAQLRAVEESLAITEGQIAQSLISTYKALGGGWEVRSRASMLAEETRQEMQDRTDWGKLLDPESMPEGPEAEPDVEAEETREENS